MNMDIVLYDDDRVDARFEGLEVATRQDGAAPAPFDLFLASIGTCAGFYVSKFCRSRGIDARAVRIRQRAERDPGAGRFSRVEIEVELPDGFPARYAAAVVRAAERCSVKKHLADPPEIAVRTVGPVATSAAG